MIGKFLDDQGNLLVAFSGTSIAILPAGKKMSDMLPVTEEEFQGIKQKAEDNPGMDLRDTQIASLKAQIKAMQDDIKSLKANNGNAPKP